MNTINGTFLIIGDTIIIILLMIVLFNENVLGFILEKFIFPIITVLFCPFVIIFSGLINIEEGNYLKGFLKLLGGFGIYLGLIFLCKVMETAFS